MIEFPVLLVSKMLHGLTPPLFVSNEQNKKENKQEKQGGLSNTLREKCLWTVRIFLLSNTCLEYYSHRTMAHHISESGLVVVSLLSHVYVTAFVLLCLYIG